MGVRFSEAEQRDQTSASSMLTPRPPHGAKVVDWIHVPESRDPHQVALCAEHEQSAKHSG